ncbi:MAG: YkgJ family cysteine cluster protein [Nibricoccus sp.]
MKIPENCCRCGVCCFSTLENYVRVNGDDWTRLGADAERMAHFAGNRAYMRMRDGHCAALEKRETADGTAEFFCSIYERRPQICRDLERGSPECEGERMMKSARTDLELPSQNLKSA